MPLALVCVWAKESGTLTCPKPCLLTGVRLAIVRHTWPPQLSVRQCNDQQHRDSARQPHCQVRAMGAHGPTGSRGQNSRCRSKASSPVDATGSDVGAQACALEMQHIEGEHARGELDELRPMRTFTSVRNARITRATLAFPCSRRVPRSQAWCSQCARDVATSAKVRAVRRAQ